MRLVLVFFFILAAHADLIVSGGFETGDFTDRTQSGWLIDTLNPNSGVYDAATGCAGASCTTVGDSERPKMPDPLQLRCGHTCES